MVDERWTETADKVFVCASTFSYSTSFRSPRQHRQPLVTDASAITVGCLSDAPRARASPKQYLGISVRLSFPGKPLSGTANPFVFNVHILCRIALHVCLAFYFHPCVEHST